MSRIQEALLHSFTQNRERIAFRKENRTYTYGDLKLKSDQIRKELAAIKTSAPVGLYLTNDFEMYAALLAIWFQGLPYVPLHPEFPVSKNEKIIRQAGCEVILTSTENEALFNTITVVRTDQCNNDVTDIPWVSADENALAYILFTSGSTGEPKGVPITFANLYYFAESYNATFGSLHVEDIVLQMFELTFDMSVVSYLMPLLAGASFVGLHDKELKFLQILDLLEANTITVAQLVPSIANLMLPYIDPQVQNSSLRSVFFAGEALLSKTIREWRKLVPNAKIYNSYGPTENTIVCSTYEIPVENAKEKNGILSIGQPMKNNILRFHDDSVDEGELLLGGKLLTPSYWKNPEKDKETFILVDGDRYYRTGDWCLRDKDGDMFYVNRIDFQAKINGFRVELSEIEHFANQCCTSGSCIVLTQKDEADNDFLILYTDDYLIQEETLIQHLKDELPPYMVPAKIVKCTAFPYNTSGKVDRIKLKEVH